MHTITEARRDLSSQIDNFSPTILNNNNVNASAQNRGGGDGVTSINNGQTVIPFVGSQQQPLNSLSHMPTCRNTTNYYHAERNDAVRQLWRQQTHACINQRSTATSVGNQVLSSSQQQQHGVVNHFGRLEQLQQLYNNLTENNAYNRQTQLLNNTMHLEQQSRRNYDTQNLIQQPSTMDQTVFLNYTSNNISHYPSPIGGNANNTYISVPQYNYQNISSPGPNAAQQTVIPQGNINYPLPAPQLPLVFGPPPRDRRPNLNSLDETRTAAFQEVFTNPAYFHETNNLNTSPSIPINSIFQSFSNHLKITPEQIALNRLTLSAQDQRNAMIVANKTNFNRVSHHQCELGECQTSQKAYCVLQTASDASSNLPDVSNISETDGTNQIYSARANMKLKFSKNVVNIPKKIETKNELETSKESVKTCPSDLYLSASSNTKQYTAEDVFNCQINNNNNININNNKLDETFSTYPASLILEEDRYNSPFVLHEESAFIDMIVEGCIHGEEIATKYQNVPCFKNIKKLCEKTKTDLMTPHCTARNIHSQGIPWATKDYIFAFTRLTSCWYLLKGYLGHKSDVFDKIEQLYSPELRKSFELWEQTTVNLAFHVMKSFIALGNNSSVKWNPSAHSTPLTTKDIRKKIVSIPPSLISMDVDESSQSSKNDLHLLARSNLDSKQNEKFYKNDAKNAYFQNHIFKPILQMNGRYDFDSGDEDSSKKYIKPGCYSVPQIRHQTSPTTSPRYNDFEDVVAAKSKKKMPPIIILSHRNEANQNNNDHLAKASVTVHHVYPQDCTKNRIEYIPFKKTPQGMITSALMKKSREDFPKPPDLSENLKTESSSDATEKLDDLENISANTTAFDVYSKKPLSKSNDLNSRSVEIESDDKIGDDDHNENQQSQRHISGFMSKANKIYGTKKQYRSIESKSSIRKGIFETTKRRPEHSEYQTKSASIKKAHKSYYNTMLSTPKYLDENSNLKLRSKCRQNVKWNIWYSRKRDGLSHLAIETFERILNELWNMPSSHHFVFEVDVRDVPDYYEIIKHPMFLTNILQKLKQYKYSSLNQVVHDFRRIFRNARIFLEAHPDKRLQRLISHFSNAFEQLLNDNFPKVDFSTIMDEDSDLLSNSTPPANNTSSRSSTPSKSDDNTSPSSQEDR